MSIRAVEWALSASVGNHLAKLVLITLANNADDETFECWPSAGYIAKRCELSERTVYRAVSFLIEHGFVRAEKRKWPNAVRRTPKYTLLGVLPISQHVLSTQTEGSATVGSRRTVTNEPSQSLGRVFVECGTDAWRAWARHFQTNKINPLGKPPVTDREGRWGWYFPTEFPQ